MAVPTALGFFTTDAQGNREGESWESLQRKRKLAEALMAQGTDSGPVQHWLQGVARVAKAGIGAYKTNELDKEEAATNKAWRDQIAAILSGKSPTTGDATATAPGGAPMGLQPGTEPPSQTTSKPASQPGQGGVGSFDTSVARTLGFEGGMNPADTNGTPSNFGINAQANPDVDVASLTPDSAKALYKTRYWDSIGADKLPPAVAHVAFDTSVIAGPGKAKELLAASGGDPMKMLELRKQFQDNLLASNPAKYGKYAKAWNNRINGLRSDIMAANQSQPQGVQVASNDPGFVPQGAPAGAIARLPAGAVPQNAVPATLPGGGGNLSRLPDSAVVPAGTMAGPPPADMSPEEIAARQAQVAAQGGGSPALPPGATAYAPNPSQSQPGGAINRALTDGSSAPVDRARTATAAGAGLNSPDGRRAVDQANAGVTAGNAPPTPPQRPGNLGQTQGMPEGERIRMAEALMGGNAPQAPQGGSGQAPAAPGVPMQLAGAQGQPAASAGAPNRQALVRALQAPAQAAPNASAGSGLPNRSAALLAMALNPALSPSQRQMASSLMTVMQAQDKVSTIDLGGSIGVVDGRGNVVRTIPKDQAAKWTRLNDGTLFNASTGETKAASGSPAYRPLVDPAERARYGIPASDTTPYQVGADGKLSAAGSKGTSISIDQKGESEFEKEAGKKQADRYNSYIAGADQAQSMIGDIGSMREISRRVGSVGAGANVKAAIGPYAEALGINIDGLSDIQAFESVIQRLAPQMRATGSGATSDIEFKGFLASLPRLSSNPQAREVILDTMEANANYKIAQGNIAAQVFNKEITRQEGEKQLRALGNPMQAFKEFRSKNPDLFTGPAASSASGTSTAPAQRQAAPANDPLSQAKDAIARGAPRDKVIERLRARGISTEGL